MSYRVTGMGEGPIEASKPTLEAAARTASRMADQGVRNVRLFDEEGREVPPAEWEQAWWRWAKEHGRGPMG